MLISALIHGSTTKHVFWDSFSCVFPLQRSCKLLVHEIAHLLGVDHCIWFSCCMNGSGHLSEDFGEYKTA